MTNLAPPSATTVAPCIYSLIPGASIYTTRATPSGSASSPGAGLMTPPDSFYFKISTFSITSPFFFHPIPVHSEKIKPLISSLIFATISTPKKNRAEAESSARSVNRNGINSGFFSFINPFVFIQPLAGNLSFQGTGIVAMHVRTEITSGIDTSRQMP